MVGQGWREGLEAYKWSRLCICIQQALGNKHNSLLHSCAGNFVEVREQFLSDIEHYHACIHESCDRYYAIQSLKANALH